MIKNRFFFILSSFLNKIGRQFMLSIIKRGTKNISNLPYGTLSRFLVNNLALVSNIGVLVTLMVVLFFVGAYLNSTNLALMIAKGTGKMINLSV